MGCPTLTGPREVMAPHPSVPLAHWHGRLHAREHPLEPRTVATEAHDLVLRNVERTLGAAVPAGPEPQSMVPGRHGQLDCLLVGDRAHNGAVHRDVPLLTLRTNADPTPRSNQPNCRVAHSSLVCAIYVAVMLSDGRCSGADVTAAASTPDAQQEVADERSRHHDGDDDLDDVGARTTQDACHHGRGSQSYGHELRLIQRSLLTSAARDCGQPYLGPWQ